MLDSNSLFSESFYLQQYSDVAQAVTNGAFKSGLDHFNQFGKSEARSASAFFDSSFYLAQNADVAQAVQNKTITSAFDHYIEVGQKENRKASIIYDNDYYLSHQTDVRLANRTLKDSLTGIEHFVKFGINEGRAGSLVFDPKYYVENNADLKAANLTNQQATEHFIINGSNEGRRASSSFDVQYYLNNNDDLKPTQLTYKQAFEEYISKGYKEFRHLKAGIVPAGSTGGKIMVGLNIVGSNKTLADNAFPSINPRLTVTEPGTTTFTAPYVLGHAISGYPFSETNAELPKTPWTADGTDIFITVFNNSNYATTKFSVINSDPVVLGLLGLENSNIGKTEFDLASSSSDAFDSITYDPFSGAITFEAIDKPGILPGKSWDYTLRYTIPEDMINLGNQNQSTLTFTPVFTKS